MTRGLPGFSEAGYQLTPGSVLGLRWFWMPTSDLPSPFSPDEPVPVPVLRGQTGFGYRAGVNEASCSDRPPGVRRGGLGPGPGRREPAHDVPADGCGCGFWAYWTREEAERHGAGGYGRVPVLGVVEATGRVIHGRKGFRAQKARIVAVHPAFSIRLELRDGHDEAHFRGVRWTRDDLADAGLAADAAVQAALARAYGIQAYAAEDAMLEMHPPGQGFLS